MVPGLKAKNRSGPSVRVDYRVHIQEIKPWPQSQSLSCRAVLIQWENGDRNSGSTNSVIPASGSVSGDGKIEFNESFKLPVTLLREMSIKNMDVDTFQKNCLELNLYELRRDKTVKGQLLATAVINLADYGIVEETLGVSVPMNCKRTVRNTAQPFLYLEIQPFDKARTGSSQRDTLSREASLDKNGGEPVSNLMNEGYVEEAEIASFTDDDVSSHSSGRHRYQENGDAATNARSRSTKEHALDAKIGLQKSDTKPGCASQEKMKAISPCASSVDLSSDPPSPHKDNDGKGHQELEDTNAKQVSAESESPSLSRDPQKNGFSKHVKSVRSAVDSAKNNGAGNPRSSDRKDTRSDHERIKIQQLEQRITMLEGELREAAAIEAALYSVAAEHGRSMSKVHAPARRLSRLYLHACKENVQSWRAGAAKSAVSGLLLVAKACGNDVPRLTFWLSNSVVLRATISQAMGEPQLPVSDKSFAERNGGLKGKNKTASSLKWKVPSSRTNENRDAVNENACDWIDPFTFTSALEKVESWIFARIIDSIWWQTLTPYMQSAVSKSMDKSVDSGFKKFFGRTSSSLDQEQGSFSSDLWKKAFKDACEKLCPIRAGGHECGCLPVLSKLIMEQCVARLDVAMFNAILREPVDEIPTDPISDPISNLKVLPIPSGKYSFGAGAQLKNTIGNWSRWLTDLFGIDDDDPCEDENDYDYPDERQDKASSKSFFLLNVLSDLMMLPKDLLLSRSTRKEVCPSVGAPIIKRVLENFVPDEFCPDRVPDALLEALDCEDPFDPGREPMTISSFPCTAAPPVYTPPSPISVADIIGEAGNISQLRQSGSLVLRKSNTSDDELDELNSPLALIFTDDIRSSQIKMKPGRVFKGGGSKNAVRYELLQNVWSSSE